MHVRFDFVNILNFFLRSTLPNSGKNLINLNIFLLQIADLQQHLLIFAIELQQLGGHLDILEDISKLINEFINLINKLGSDTHQARSDLLLPYFDSSRVYEIRLDCLGCQRFNSFEIVHLFFVFLVNVQEFFLRD